MCATSSLYPRAIPPAICRPRSLQARGQISRMVLHTLDAKCIIKSSFRGSCVSGARERSFGENEITADLPKRDYFLMDFSL